MTRPELQQIGTDAPFQALLESAPDAIVIVDGSGRIVLVNEQAERLFGYQRAALIGQMVEVLLPERLRNGHTRYRGSYFTAPHTRPMGSGLELVARRQDGSEFPVEISLSPLHTEAGLLITSAIRDVSERKRAEAELRRQTAFVQLLQLVAVTANQAVSVESAVQRVLEQVCTHLGWLLGHAYFLAGDSIGELVPTALWYLEDPERFVPFQQATEMTRFVPGVGLVGQVLASGRPAWMADVRTDPNFIRAQQAQQVGLRTGFALPVLVGAEVVAVLEFFTTEAVERDAPLLEVLAHVGTQLGRVVERARGAAELEGQVQRRTAHLGALLQFSNELLTARSLDATLQRAVSHALTLLPEAQCGAIYLYDQHDQQLALTCSAGFGVLPARRVLLATEIVGRAFTSGHVQVISSAAENSAGTAELTADQQRQLAHALGLPQPPTVMIALPLIARTQTIGVLLLLRSGESAADRPFDGSTNRLNEGFTADALATLEGLANLTAVAILEERSVRAAATLAGQLARLEEQQRTLTERLDATEAGMLQAARLAAVGQLAASIAHEINNPLYAARNCLALLEQDAPAAMRESPFLAIARDQLTRIAHIIERMREFYRPDRGTLAPCDIHRLLEETLALAGLNIRHQSIRVIFTPAPDLPEVVVADDQLRQVFLNLILNAIEAMPDGGALTVRTIAGPTVALIEVQDTGIGIPADIRPQLFEPFFTNKPNGTGLGLSISAHIVTQHGGQIEVDSCEGQGSTFRVVLPYHHDR
jgi:two-component system NtrC family sensor kinase